MDNGYRFSRERVATQAHIQVLRSGGARAEAFTLIELLVVIAVIAIPCGPPPTGALKGQGEGVQRSVPVEPEANNS
jgi:prepilin-type N-terminal cleavage/methylation domain-containing protein